MIIYWLLFFTAATASLLHFIDNTKYIEFVSFLFLFSIILFVAGFRYASIDYFGYEYLYHTTSIENFSLPFFKGGLGTTGKEFFWATMSSGFNYFGFSFPVWVFFIALISITIKFYFYKKYSKYFLLAIAIYITQSFIKDMGQIRNGLAGGVLLFSILPILERDVKKFLIVVVIAFGIQAYAIIALPLYWLYPFFTRLKYTLILTLIVLSLLSFYGGIADLILTKMGASSLINERIMHKLEGYSEQEVTNLSIVSITGISYVLISISLILFKERIHQSYSLLSVMSLFHFYGVSLFLLFTGINTINNRSLDLFSMTALPFLLTTPLLFCKGDSRLFGVVVIISFCALRLYSNMSAFYPYEIIF